MHKYTIAMKKSLLVSFLFLISLAVFSQIQKADKYFDKGVKAFQSGNYKEAISCFTQSAYEFPSASNSYFNRAVSYYHIGDSCNFCADLKKATGLGHADAPKLYDENCIFKRIILALPDSIKIKYSYAIRLEIVKFLCSNDSLVNVVSMKEGNIWSEEIGDTEQNGEGEIYTIVENMPQYPGGEEARNKLLATNIIYPATATQNGIQGTVYVSFIVEKDGAVSNVKVIRGIGGGCDEESIRVVKLMPKWIPGTQKGKPVRVLFNMPMYYKLSNNLIPNIRK